MMDPRIEEQAHRLEAILPLILRTIYPPREDDPFAELPLMQLRVVRALSGGPRTMSEVAEELRMSPSRLAHLVARLEAVELVEKRCCAEDRRIKFVELTPLGKSQMGGHQRLRADRAAEILDGLDGDERSRLMEALEGLYRQAKSVALITEVRDISSIVG